MSVTSAQYLHSLECGNTPQDVARMQKILATDPQALERTNGTWYGQGITSLFRAASAGHKNCVEFLINSGANTSLMYNDDDLMTEAVVSGDLETVSYLLEHGFNPNYECHSSKVIGRTYYVNTATTISFNNSRKKYKCIKLLIDYGAHVDDFRNVDLKTYSENCPSTNSILLLCTTILKLLLLHGAAVDGQKCKNLSPEMNDCVSLIQTAAVLLNGIQIDKEKAILNILYQFGADMWQKNRHGLNPLQLRENSILREQERALRCDLEEYQTKIDPIKFKEVSEYLKELMANPLSLKSLARVSIIRAMGPEYLHNLPKLPPLPRQIKAYLRMCDVGVGE